MLNPGLLYLEKENRKKGIRISVITHIIVLLLALWPFLSNESEKAIDKQYAIEISFDPRGASNSFKGTAAEGAQRPRHEEVEKMGGSSVNEIPVQTPTPPVKQPKVQPPTPKSTPSKVDSDIYENDTDVFATNDADLETNEIPKSKSTSSKKSTQVVVNSDANNDPEDVPAKKPSSTTGSGSGTGSGTATGSGTGTSTSSNKDGTGTGQGNKGTGSGKDKSGNDESSGAGTGGPGTGVFDGSGNGIFGRQPVIKPKISELKLDKSGRIAFKICIDQKGRSTFVDYISSGSTIKDKKAIKLAIDYVGRFIWQEDYSVKKEQCGKYTLIIDNKTN